MANRESPLGCIDITSPINAGQTATISNKLSAFELVGAVVYGAAGVTATIQKNGVTAAVARYTATEGNDCTLVNAQASFATADSLTIVVSGANATRVVLHTRYPDAYAYGLTVVVA